VDFWVVEILRKDSHAMNYLLLSAGSESKRWATYAVTWTCYLLLVPPWAYASEERRTGRMMMLKFWVLQKMWCPFNSYKQGYCWWGFRIVSICFHKVLMSVSWVTAKRLLLSQIKDGSEESAHYDSRNI
jgi:hypothetical protein